ncbi:MAG: hypothetical protein ACFB4I_09085 [Cyanophyceae cyanobacterium]
MARDLAIEIESFDLPDGVTMGDPGEVTVSITNVGDRRVGGRVDLNLYASSDSVINTRVLERTEKEVNDGLLTTVEGVRLRGLRPGESRTVTIDYENITSYVPPGSYYLIAEIDGDSLRPRQDSNPDNNFDAELVSSPNTDVVLDWMATGMNLSSNEYLYDEFEEVGAAPPQGTRAGAFLASSMYNVYAGITGEFEAYGIDLSEINMSTEGISLEAAIAGAAYTSLAELFPEQRDQLNEQLGSSIDEIEADPAAEMMGMAYGMRVAKELLLSREDELETDDPDNYPFESLDPNDPFFWGPDDNGSGISVGAGYGNDAEPWAIDSTDEIIALSAPDPRDSEAYIQDLQAVAALGGKEDTELTTITRTPDQAEIAKFYFIDRGDSYKPNKHLNHMLAEISIREELSLEDNIQAFFLTNIALADAIQVAWDAKYTHQIPRPSQPIKELLDPEWENFLEDPPFPDYVSGHGTMVMAVAPIWEELFGENYAFDVVSPDTPGIVRSVESFEQLAEEFAFSRVFSGVHTIKGAVTDTQIFGEAVAEQVLAKLAPDVEPLV